jgi:hypothetical protein
MGGGQTPFGQALGKGFQQMQQGAGNGPGQEQHSMIPEFNYKPGKGLNVNIGDPMLMALMSSMMPKPQQQQMMPPGQPGQPPQQMQQMQQPRPPMGA